MADTRVRDKEVEESGHAEIDLLKVWYVYYNKYETMCGIIYCYEF